MRANNTDAAGNPVVMAKCAARHRPPLVLSTDYRIRWLHVPKTGTSFANAIFHIGCPGLPTWASMLVGKGDSAEQYYEQCHSAVANSEHCHLRMPGTFGKSHVAISEPWAPQTSAYVMLLRDPTARLMSAYHSRRHLCVNCSAATTFVDYARWSARQNRGIMTNMILGRWGAREAAPYPANKQIEEANKRLADFAFVGIVEYWPQSMCLFHDTFGGDPKPFEFANVRPSTHGKSGLHLAEARQLLEAAGLFDRSDKKIYAFGKDLFHKRYARSKHPPLAQPKAPPAQPKEPPAKSKAPKTKEPPAPPKELPAQPKAPKTKEPPAPPKELPAQPKAPKTKEPPAQPKELPAQPVEPPTKSKAPKTPHRRRQ
ncbi:hypothetical protein M885DRAFT_563459 [Pelagophyceae sp. CCMP2097]|nr:hypothetical protein M885DRAFT_563459 [Pelagophyceae sp. CCMP2097]